MSVEGVLPAGIVEPYSLESGIWRGAMYEALALAFSYPNTSTLVDLADALDDLCVHDLTGSARLAAACEALRDALRAETAASLVAVYNRLFAAEVPCPPCETAYEFDPFARTRQLADIAGFYRAFGLKVAPAVGGPVDFVATELDFMSHVVAKELHARSSERVDLLDITLAAERSFLEDHLGRWVPVFSRKLVDSEGIDRFYGAAACLCDAFVQLEIESTGVKPRPAGLPRAAADIAEPFTCPLATSGV